MNRRLVLFVLALAAASFLLGCGPKWRVVSQAHPNPLRTQGSFAVLPVDYAGLHIGDKSEAEYLAGKTDKQSDSFAADKKALADEFAAALIAQAAKEGITVVLATGPASAPFQIRPRVQFIEPGFFVGVASGSSQVVMDLKITAPDGRVIDQIEVAHSSNSASGVSIGGFQIPTDPSSGGRLRKDGKGIGEIVAKYLAFRVGGGSE
jgi:hypothetical protein